MSETRNELEAIARNVAKAACGGVSIKANGVDVNRELLKLIEIVTKQEDRIVTLESLIKQLQS